MESGRISPAVGLLQAISPDPDRPDNKTLSYPQLAYAAQWARSAEDVLLRAFYAADEASPAQRTAAWKLAEYELIETANALQRAENPALQHELTAQFTKASVDLFGAPRPDTTAYLVEQLMTELCILQTNHDVDGRLLDTLLATYDDILDKAAAPREYVLPFDDSAAREAAAMLGNFLDGYYSQPLRVFDGNPAQRLKPGDMVERFETALGLLQAQNDMWRDWQVLVTDDSCLAVNPVTKRLVIGSRRTSAKLGELRGLFGHEVLVHALRAANGRQLSAGLASGLPGYIDAEEGLGCFVEHALLGVPPQKMYDRYTDVALALGTLDGRSRSRRELFDIVFSRRMVRAQADGYLDLGTIERESWAHVNRIFRGTLGNELVGVFTKDIAYYHGYQKIAAFFADELAGGATIDELWSFLAIGKFDPTDALHVIELAANA